MSKLKKYSQPYNERLYNSETKENIKITKKKKYSQLTVSTRKNVLFPGLYIVSTPIGNLRDITIRALDILSVSDYVICEDTRVTKKLLNSYKITSKTITYNDHNSKKILPKILGFLEKKMIISLVSDAGTPTISDPGLMLIREVVKNNYYLTSVPGPNALTTAYSLSTFSSSHFIFLGFLPRKHGEKKKLFSSLVNLDSSIIFFESAKRVTNSLVMAKNILGNRELVFARELTKLHEEVKRGRIDDFLNDNSGIVIKGELTIIIAPPEKKPVNKYSDERIDQLIRLLLRHESVKDISRNLHKILECNKNDIYKRALDISLASKKNI